MKTVAYHATAQLHFMLKIRHLSTLQNANNREFYKNMSEKDNNNKPSNWNDALLFEKIPGPKPLPFIGNMWRFLPYIGDYHDKAHLEFLN